MDNSTPKETSQANPQENGLLMFLNEDEVL